MIDSIKFLAHKSDPREHLHTPFYIEGHQVHTNDHVILFTPSPLHKVCKNNFPADYFEQRLRKLMENISDLMSWERCDSNILGEKHKCNECGGIGHIKQIVCNECDGDGAVILSSSHSTYECECKTCHGFGEIRKPATKDDPICDECKGIGESYLHEQPLIFLNSVAINPNYFAFIAGEDDLHIAVDDSNILYFKSFEQFGAIMGLNGYDRMMKKEAA